MKITTLVAGALALTAGLTLGIPTAGAAPKPEGATLNIAQDPQHANNYVLQLFGTYPMEQADAVGYLNNINNGKCKGAITYTFYADDGDYVILEHDYVPGGAYVNPTGYFRATSEGLSYSHTIALRKNFLNEDNGVFDDTDEIFAQASFMDSDCNYRIHTSKVISRVL